MSGEEFLDLMEKIRLVYPPFPLKIMPAHLGNGDGRIILTGVIPDRDSGQLKPIEWSVVLNLAVLTVEELPQKIRELLHKYMAHEIDEALHVNGVRMFDPHKEKV